MIKIYYKAITDKNLKKLANFRVGSWVYVEDPDKKDLDYLEKNFSFDPSLLQDALDPFEVPRVEVDKEITYIYATVPNSEDGIKQIINTPVLIAIGSDFLVTVSRKSLPFLQKFVKGKVDFTTTQKTRLFFQIFSEINAAYDNFLKNIGRNIRRIIINLEKINNEDIVKFVTFEATLNEFLSDLVPINASLQKLHTGKLLKLYEEDKDLVEDLFLSSGQLIDISNFNLRSIVNIREAYSTLMTNNLNKVIKLLTSLTVIFTIPTIIGSLYGMNVRLPYSDSPHAFYGILVVIALISSFLLAIFARNRWL